jgi:hypothetical protein
MEEEELGLYTVHQMRHGRFKNELNSMDGFADGESIAKWDDDFTDPNIETSDAFEP